MIKFTKGNEIFITYGTRSSEKYWPLISEKVKEHFGNGPFEDKETVRKVLLFCLDFAATNFSKIITQTDDVNFVFYLFANHEASINLYLRRLKGENLEQTEDIKESVLALNRRILKLALEQTIEVDYTNQRTQNQEILNEYVEKVEDILFLGSQLYGFADHLAEERMVEGCNRIIFNKQGLIQVERKHHYEHVYDIMNDFFEKGFSEGIFDNEIVKELREKLKECMGIDYDFAGGLIFHIKEHHSPGNSKFQTIEPGILAENLIKQGVDKKSAENFYEGLTISRKNKLKVTEAIYKVNSFERHMFRPILIINFKGENRALVGENKWAESIMVMATNGFQWQRAPIEWLQNQCFKEYLMNKSNEHDKHLEDEVETILKDLNILFCRNILSFTNSKDEKTRIDIEGVGEMDFVIVDQNAKKIIVTDCKYNRARYEMVGFSTDYTNFQTQYEPKLQRKIEWVKENKSLVIEHFQRAFSDKTLNFLEYEVEGLFIINTPTFYMMNGEFKTINISRLENFIKSSYEFPVISLQLDGGETVKEIKHPYFKIQ